MKTTKEKTSLKEKIFSFPEMIREELNSLTYPSKETMIDSTKFVLISSVIVSIIVALDTGAVSYLCSFIIEKL